MNLMSRTSARLARTEPGLAPPKQVRTALIVLGMHRSGTSAITGALRLCGAWVGETDALTGANAQNPKGFWERRDLRKICDGMLHAAGADWWQVGSFDPAAVQHAALAKYGREFQAVVNQLNHHGTWIIKEPRLCLLFPILRFHIADPVCIHTSRHPLEIAQSLRVRNGFGITEGLALWELYTRSALNASTGLPRLLVSYEKLISDPHAEIGRIVRQLQELGVTGLKVPEQAKIDDFLTSKLHRQRVAGEQPLDLLMPSQRKLWDLLESGAALDTDIPHKLTPITRQCLLDLEARKSFNAEAMALRKVTNLNEELAAERARRNELSVRTAELSARLEDRKIRVTNLNEKLAAEQARRNELASKLTAQNERVKAQRRALQNLKRSTSWRITRPMRGASHALSWLGRNTRRISRLIGWLARGNSLEL